MRGPPGSSRKAVFIFTFKHLSVSVVTALLFSFVLSLIFLKDFPGICLFQESAFRLFKFLLFNFPVILLLTVFPSFCFFFSFGMHSCSFFKI